MSVLTRIGRVLRSGGVGGAGRRRRGQAVVSGPAGPAQAQAAGEGEGEGTGAAVVVEASPQAGPTASLPLTARDLSGKNRQEVIAELKQHYAEVIELVRKVNAHLDEQQERAARLVSIAERMDRAVAALPEIREHSAKVSAGVEELVALARSGGERAEEAYARQARVFADVAEVLRHVETSHTQVAGSLAEVTGALAGVDGAITGVAGATEGLNAALRAVRERGEEQERRLERLLDANRKWMMLMVSVAGAAVVLTALVAIVARL